MGLDTFEFNEDRARAGAGLWSEVAASFDAIAQKADGIKGEPWGHDDKIAKAFNSGEDGFTKVRDTIVGIAKNNLKPALDSVGPNLTNAANQYVEQARNRTTKP
ncbi:hypothetical protein [Mycobacterium talmoniae]|uniref:Proteins of 100 residues with WXG n=1 Tax=Mycobacterium talmoniae TaxID=1858794 RepID=A0A2S8BF28_9MYCO|nr:MULTISPECIES: hypothetical protein [Mycobacterium]PQM45287.1 hypothetical protein C1Y40_04544 [Mycobacterium talmoniae]TDH49303.1 hypothetical protein E2F47_21080 [Mycobacterium eburneum]